MWLAAGAAERKQGQLKICKKSSLRLYEGQCFCCSFVVVVVVVVVWVHVVVSCNKAIV